MPRGGYHPHADRWGRKSGWKNDSVTKTIRVPEALADKILDIAHKLDEDGIIDYDTKAEWDKELNELHQKNGDLNLEVEELRSQLREADFQCVERLNNQWLEYESHMAKMREKANQPLPDLEAARDRFLACLGLGKQAPEYKRTKIILNRFLEYVLG